MARSRRRAFLVRLAWELAVVFVGVYAAFALAELQTQREAESRRRQLQAALVREISDITENTRLVAQTLPPQLQQFDSAIAAGAQPPLEPWIEPIRVQTHMWEATLTSGALELFDVRTVYSLSEFYNELNAGFEQLLQLRNLSESVLIPNLGNSAAEFYLPDGQLRPKYQWYRDGLGRLSSLARQITNLGDSLTTALAQQR